MDSVRRRVSLSGLAGSGSGSGSGPQALRSLSLRQVHSFARRGLMQETVIFIVIIAIGATILTIGVAWVCYKRGKQRKRDTKYRQALGEENLEAQPISQEPSGAPSTTQNGTGSRTGRGTASRSANASSSNRNAAGTINNNNNNNNNTTIDRNTSIRSVMTLPAYRLNPAHNEQVLGREGERDGIDTVVDLPTEEEMEALRDEEMEAMYQIRVARRQQIDEQQQRRVERRDAQQRGDSAALASIRAQARAARNSNPLDSLRREMERAKELRNRSVSSVSYAELGVARHDGTRIRANSNDSERMSLLAEAAGVASSTAAVGSSGLSNLSAHGRAASVSSVLSVDSETASLSLSRSQGPLLPSGNPTPEPAEADLGDEHIPPPEYENISLADEQDSLHSTLSINEPPPDYPGPRRSASLASQATQRGGQASEPRTITEEDGAARRSLRASIGPDGIPRLPSLRLAQLPEIVIGP